MSARIPETDPKFVRATSPASGCLAMLAVLAFLSLASPAPAQLIEFKFDPPDGAAWTQTVLHDQRRESADGTSRSLYTVVRSRASIRRQSAGAATGFVLEIRPVAAAVFRDGERVRDPAFEAVLTTPVTLRLDAAGRALEVLGYEDLRDRVAAALPRDAPPATVEATLRLFDGRALAAREKSEWDGRVARLSGRKAEVGDGWGSYEQAPLPTGDSVTFQSGTKIEERFQCGRRICVRLLFQFDTDEEGVRNFLGDSFDLLPREAARPAGPLEVNVEGGGERVVDPSTLLVRSERAGRTLEVKTPRPGGGEPVTTIVRESREYRYEYEGE